MFSTNFYTNGVMDNAIAKIFDNANNTVIEGVIDSVESTGIRALPSDVLSRVGEFLGLKGEVMHFNHFMHSIALRGDLAKVYGEDSCTAMLPRDKAVLVHTNAKPLLGVNAMAYDYCRIMKTLIFTHEFDLHIDYTDVLKNVAADTKTTLLSPMLESLFPNVVVTTQTFLKRGPEADNNAIVGELRRTARARRFLTYELKDLFFKMMLIFPPTHVVHAHDGLIGAHLNLFGKIFNFIVASLRVILHGVVTFIEYFLMVFNIIWGNLNSVCLGCSVDEIAVLLLWSIIFYLTRRWYTNRDARRIVECDTVNLDTATIVAKMRSGDSVKYKLKYNNKIYLIGEGEIESVEDEMSMSGSELFPSASRPVGAILIETSKDEFNVVGCFFRVKDYLVTAKHVANFVNTGIAKVFITGTKANRKGNFVVDAVNAVEIDRELFNIDDSAFTSKGFDVFAMLIEKKLWCKVGVTAVKVKTPSAYNQQISTVGFNNSVLVTASGKTLADSGCDEIWYTATTNKSFSGSPVFCGSSVVGMHIVGTPKCNIAVRIEAIKARLTVDEGSFMTSDSVELDVHDTQVKWQGEPVDFYDSYDGDIIMNRRGEVINYGDEDFVVEIRDRIREHRRDHDAEDQEDAAYARASNKGRRFGRYAHFQNENAEIRHKAYTIVTTKKPVHCAEADLQSPEAQKLLEHFNDRIEDLGFESGTFGYPIIDRQSEEKSLLAHLELYDERFNKIQKPPTDNEQYRCAMLVTQLLAHNTFKPRVDYKSTNAILDIIDSTIVKDSKSPGFPYQSDGMPTNGAVLKKMTKEAFAEHALREWDEEFEWKVFLKNEAHPSKKLANGMIRCIAGMPLHKMIKHQCMFREAIDVFTANYRDTPASYGFNPATPGDVEWLWRKFKDKRVFASDKSKWDYNMFPYVFNICTKVIQNLAVKPSGMSEEQFSAYLNDIESSVKEVMNATYRLSNGKCVKPTQEGIMKSGWVMTILVNTIAQIVIDVLTKTRMQLTDEQILSKEFDLTAGGDDTLNAFPDDFDVEMYLEKMRELGIDVTEYEERCGLEDCEFFSHRFHMREGIIVYIPQRFTKHIYKLSHCNVDDIPASLSSHMMNYCWDRKKFELFRDMFVKFSEDYPEKTNMILLRSMLVWRYKSKGMECDFEV